MARNKSKAVNLRGKLRFLLGLTAVFAARVLTASHPEFQPGDLFVAAYTRSVITANGQVLWYHPDATQERILFNRFGHLPHGITVAPSGEVFATTSFNVRVFTSNAERIFLAPDYLTGGIVLDDAASMYVSALNGPFVYKYDAGGNLQQTIQISGATVAMDLAADQCTLFYQGVGLIRRHDVCAGRVLPDFAALPTQPAGLRILPDGRVLVAAQAAIYLLSSAGEITRTYDTSGMDAWVAVALRPDGQSFWAADTGCCVTEVDRSRFFVFDLQSSAPILGPVETTLVVTSLAVMGEPRAAAPPVPIPTLGGWILALLALLIAVIGVWRVR